MVRALLEDRYHVYSEDEFEKVYFRKSVSDQDPNWRLKVETILQSQAHGRRLEIWTGEIPPYPWLDSDQVQVIIRPHIMYLPTGGLIQPQRLWRPKKG